MPENDNRPALLVHPSDILIALALLTRLPIRLDDAHFTRSAQAAWAYPIAGLVLGMIAGLAGHVALSFGLPNEIAALISLATLIMVSGAMHEDGLADTVDGFWGGWDRAVRLEIMHDSRIGTYGVIALALSLAARWMALTLLFSSDGALFALMAAGALSRAMMPVLMYAMPHARNTGLSKSVGRPTRETTMITIAISVVIFVILQCDTSLSGIIVAGIFTLGMAAIAHRKIGGQTGDILGATQQICEIAILFALLP